MNSNEIFAEATYAWLDSEYDFVEMEIAAKDVKVGDLFVDGTVTATKFGTKWAYLTVQRSADTKTAELPLQIVVKVSRKTQTEASRQADRRVYANRVIAKRVTERAEGTDEALANVAHEISQYGAAGYGSLSNLMSEQAKRALLNEFVGFATRQSASFEDAYAAKQAFIEVLKERLSRSSFRALSRSTSVVSNLLEDVARETELRFVEDSRWDY